MHIDGAYIESVLPTLVLPMAMHIDGAYIESVLPTLQLCIKGGVEQAFPLHSQARRIAGRTSLFCLY